MKIADLFARIGVKTDEEKAKSFLRTMVGVKIGLTAATTAAAGASLAIRKITSDALASAVAFRQFEAETGASAQELQKWQSVAEQTNNTAESVTAAVKAIADNQAKLRLGQGNISGYQLLGIDPKQDPFKILDEVRKKTQNLTESQRKNILSMMGIGAGMLQTLALTDREFNALAGNAFIISPEAIRTLDKTKASLDLAGRAVKWLKAQIAVGLAPQIADTTRKIVDFIKANEEGFIKGFQMAYRYVQLFLGAIGNTAAMLNSLVKNTVGWGNALKGLAIALGGLLVFSSPLGILIAGMVLLVAVLDDLYIYSKGGKSLFGMLKDIDLSGMLGQFGVLSDIIFGIVDGIKFIAEWAERKTGVSSSYSSPEEQRQAFNASQQSINQAMFSGMFPGLSNAINQQVEINVNGAEDPGATADAVNQALRRELNAAAAQVRVPR